MQARASAQSSQIVLFDVVLFEITTVRIRAFTVQIELGRTIDPAEARLFLRMLVDDNHNHVARNCAAFVSAAIPQRGTIGPGLMRVRCCGTIVLNSFF
jgi:hypothetical protein